MLRHAPALSPDDERPGGRRSQAAARGQVILIGVITMGVLLISMTLVMNGFLYTQNIESEGVPREVSDIEAFQQMVTIEYGTLLVRSNEHDATPRTDFDAATAEAGQTIRTHAVRNQGRLRQVTLQSATPGVLLRQTDGGPFTDAAGNAWNLSASDVRRFQLAVNQTTDLHQVSAINTSELEDAFHISVADDDGSTWTMYVATEGGTDTVIAVENGSGVSKRYDAAGSIDSLTVDVTTGSVNEAGTPSVDAVGIYADGFAANLDSGTSAYRIEVHNPQRIDGDYALTVPEDALAVNGTFNATDASPYRKDVVYAARLGLTYESAAHSYTGTLHVAPCTSRDRRCLSYIRAAGDA